MPTWTLTFVDLSTTTVQSPVTLSVANGVNWKYNNKKVDIAAVSLANGETASLSGNKETSNSPRVVTDRLQKVTVGDGAGSLHLDITANGNATFTFTPSGTPGDGQDFLVGPASPPAITIKVRRQ